MSPKWRFPLGSNTGEDDDYYDDLYKSLDEFANDNNKEY